MNKKLFIFFFFFFYLKMNLIPLEHKKKFSLKYYLILIFLIMFLGYFGYLNSIKNDYYEPSTIQLPETILPNINESYNKWNLPIIFLEKLYIYFQNSPINPLTNQHFLMFTVFNKGMINFAKNWFCSLNNTDIPKNSFVMIALDLYSFNQLLSISAPVIYLNSKFSKNAVNNQKIIDFYEIVKIRPTILHQILLWKGEAILSDIDIIFFSNPLNLFQNLNNDFEIQSDSKEFVKIPLNLTEIIWKFNLGFYKVYPTKPVLQLFPIWLVNMYNTPKLVDQSSLRKILKFNKQNWIKPDIIEVFWNNEYLKFRYLDPMLAVNAGGALLEGKNKWIKEAKLRNLTSPILCHFFHIGSISQKEKLINKFSFLNNNKCIKSNWKLWI